MKKKNRSLIFFTAGGWCDEPVAKVFRAPPRVGWCEARRLYPNTSLLFHSRHAARGRSDMRSPLVRPRASSPAASLGGELQLKVSKRKGRLQFYVQHVTSAGTSQPVWLPADQPGQRQEKVLAAWPTLRKDEINEDFWAALLDDPAAESGDRCALCPARISSWFAMTVALVTMARAPSVLCRRLASEWQHGRWRNEWRSCRVGYVSDDPEPHRSVPRPRCPSFF